MSYDIAFSTDFKRNPYKGKLIALEGIDGSGKTTQAHKIVDILNKKDIRAVFTKEPTDKITGKLIREFLSGKMKFSPVAFQYLFAADRAVHQEEIEPQLKKGLTLISDRYFWSSVVYGTIDKKIDFSDVLSNFDHILVAHSILSMYHQFLVPDMTFYLRVSVPTSLARLREKDIHSEIYEKKSNLEKLAKGYDWLAKKFPKEITVVNGEGSLEEVTERMISRINK